MKLASKQVKQPKSAAVMKCGKAANAQPVRHGRKGVQQPKGQTSNPPAPHDRIEETGPDAEPASKPGAHPIANSDETTSVSVGCSGSCSLVTSQPKVYDGQQSTTAIVLQDAIQSSPTPSNSELLHGYDFRQRSQAAGPAANASAAAAGPAIGVSLKALPQEDERARKASSRAQQPLTENNQGHKAAGELHTDLAPAVGVRPQRAAAVKAIARLAANPDCARAPAAPGADQASLGGLIITHHAQSCVVILQPSRPSLQANKSQQGAFGATARRQVKSPFKARRVLGTGGMLAGKRFRKAGEGPQARWLALGLVSSLSQVLECLSIRGLPATDTRVTWLPTKRLTLQVSGQPGSPAAVAGAMLDTEDQEEPSPARVDTRDQAQPSHPSLDAEDSDEPMLAQPYEQVVAWLQANDYCAQWAAMRFVHHNLFRS